jgi:tripartite-type tricarboxylate transporter receptor subunit TctC
MGEEGYPAFGNVVGYLGVFGPANLPATTLQRLNAELVKIVRSPEVSEFLIQGGTEPSGNSPQEFAALVRQSNEAWGRVIRQIGLKLD